MVFTVATVLAMLAIIVLAGREVAVFRGDRDAYPLRRLTLRVSTAFCLVFLLGSILVGVHPPFHLDDLHRTDPRVFLAFWGCIGLLTCAVLCLVIADLRTIQEETRHESSQLWREIAETIAAHEKPPKDD